MTPITVTAIERHRNGISGIGFYLVKFLYDNDGLLCIRHDKQDDEVNYYSVINPADLNDSCKAEYFIEAIDGAIELHRQSIV